MIRLPVKALSANQSWMLTSRTFKTPVYQSFRQQIHFSLIARGFRKLGFNKKASMCFHAVFGISARMDLDNCLKPFIDVLEDFYGFNDSQIAEIHVKKVKVKKGEEFIEFCLQEKD